MGAHYFATYDDGSPAFCSCGHDGDLLAHAQQVLPPV